MPIVIGAPRSGTTLLRFMLDAHPSLAIPPETGFLAASALLDCDLSDAEGFHQVVTHFPPDAPAWNDFDVDADVLRRELLQLEPFDSSEGFRAFYRLYAEGHGKPRYGDKTPMYCEHVDLVARLLPEAHFIHIIRDGRDTALSLRSMWFAPARDVPALAAYWVKLIGAARGARRRVPAYMELRYEDLVCEPERVLRNVCRFIDLPFDERMLRYWEQTPERLREHRTRHKIDGSVLVTYDQRREQQRLTMSPPLPERLYRWKTEMTPEEQDVFWRIAGDTLTELGYESG